MLFYQLLSNIQVVSEITGQTSGVSFPQTKQLKKLIALYFHKQLVSNSWIKIDQLEVTCFIISLFNAQHVSNVSTSILRSMWLICWVISWVVLLRFDVCWCYGVVRLGWSGIFMQAEALVLQPDKWHQVGLSLFSYHCENSEVTDWYLSNIKLRSPNILFMASEFCIENF